MTRRRSTARRTPARGGQQGYEPPVTRMRGGGMVEVVIVGPPGRDGPQQLHPGQGTDLVRGRHGMTAQKLECLGSGTYGPGPRSTAARGALRRGHSCSSAWIGGAPR